MIVNYRKIQETKSLMHQDLATATRVGSLKNGAKDTATKTIFLKWPLSTWFHFPLFHSYLVLLRSRDSLD